MTRIVLLVFEVVGATDDTEVSDRIDLFREMVRPSLHHGIRISRANTKDVELFELSPEGLIESVPATVH